MSGLARPLRKGAERGQISTAPAQGRDTERICTSPAQTERICTSPAQTERISTAPAQHAESKPIVQAFIFVLVLAAAGSLSQFSNLLNYSGPNVGSRTLGRLSRRFGGGSPGTPRNSRSFLVLLAEKGKRHAGTEKPRCRANHHTAVRKSCCRATKKHIHERTVMPATEKNRPFAAGERLAPALCRC